MNSNEPNLSGRRPLKVRSSRLAQRFARYLSGKNITPNQISLLSIVSAAIAALAFLLVPLTSGIGRDACYVVVALGIQGRLLCNLFDGMVAVEGGKSTPAGELFNDMPDRVSDALILIAAGYALLDITWGGILGWLTAILAILTAYVRTLATAIGAPTRFLGPMAKQQRMALLTAAAIGCIIENTYGDHNWTLFIALIVMPLGCLATLYRRTRAAYEFLQQHPS